MISDHLCLWYRENESFGNTENTSYCIRRNCSWHIRWARSSTYLFPTHWQKSPGCVSIYSKRHFWTRSSFWRNIHALAGYLFSLCYCHKLDLAIFYSLPKAFDSIKELGCIWNRFWSCSMAIHEPGDITLKPCSIYSDYVERCPYRDFSIDGMHWSSNSFSRKQILPKQRIDFGSKSSYLRLFWNTSLRIYLLHIHLYG